jgi:hypothetical protein
MKRMYVLPAEFRDMICRTFDVLYREGADSGRAPAIALRPYNQGRASPLWNARRRHAGLAGRGAA